MFQPTDLLKALLYIHAPDRDAERRGHNALVLAACLCLASLAVGPLVVRRPDGLITGGIALAMAVVYGATMFAARRGAVTAAGYLLTGATMLVVVVNTFLTGQLRVAPYTLMICVLIAGLTLRPREVGIVLIGSFVALATMNWRLADVPQEPLPVPQLLAIVAVLTTLVAVISMLGARSFGRVVADIQQSRQAVELSEAEARRLAWSDPLTGLANRRCLQELLLGVVRRSAEPGSSCDAVLLLDLDRFKTINDSLGHVVGDRLLQAVAQRLLSVVRPTDTVARLGGDEFAVLLHGIGTAEAALAIADRIHACFALPFELHGHTVVSSTSIGLVVATAVYRAPEELLRDADSALYRAKDLGRARSAVFDTAMYQTAIARLELEADLRHAVARGELSLDYQPVVELGSGRVLGVEALLRWSHSTRGMISPAVFIPVAEETGLIVPLGNWVLRTACRQLRQLHRAGWSDLRLAVNLSPRQFHNGGLVTTIREVLAETGVQPQFLEIELTESSLMDDVRSAMQQLAALHQLGLRIAIDDFGTGYSSLAYLKRFPIDTLKIDRAFVTDCAQAKHDAAIVSATIALAQSLGLSTIAEGVENLEQLQFLQANGCEAVQGYYFSRPLAPDALVAWLQRAAQNGAQAWRVSPLSSDARVPVVASA